MMNVNASRKIYFYKGRLPFYFFPLALLGLIVLSVLAVLGLFIGIAVGTVAIGYFMLRYLLSSNKTERKRVEDDGRTIVLRDDEYEVIEKRR